MLKKIFGTVLMLLLVSIVALAFNVQSVKANPKIIYVDDDNTAGPWDGTPEHPYQNITSGLEYAAPDDTIFVYNGTYHENVVLNKTVALLGENKETTIIDADRISINANNTIIRAFTIKLGELSISPTLASFEPGNVTLTPPPSGNVVEDNNIMGYPRAGPYRMVWLASSINNTIRRNDIQVLGTGDGIVMSRLRFITIYGSVTGPPSGWNVIESNNVTCRSALEGAVCLTDDSFNNIVCNNVISTEYYSGILLDQSGNNSVKGNTVINSGCGISLNWSSNNTIYHNNFINNSVQARSSESTNWWDDNYPSGGNYWSNYTGVDADMDAIGDTTYVMDGNNTDRYPLMAPFYMFDAGTWNGTAYNVYVVSNSTASNFQLDTTQKTISFNVTGVEGTLGICRITIPNIIVEDLWHGNYTVLLNAEPWPFRNWTDATNTYIYVNYTHSGHEIIIVPEFPSTIILPLFMVLSVIAVVFAKKKRKKI